MPLFHKAKRHFTKQFINCIVLWHTVANICDDDNISAGKEI